MNKVLPPVFALLVTAMLCGCGGGGAATPSGSGTSTGPVTVNGNNPLTGSYGGSGSANSTTDSLLANIGVSSDGILCGTITDNTAKTKTLLGAQVTQAGAVTNGSFQTYDASGNPQGKAGNLSGKLTALAQGQTGPATVSAVLTATTEGTITTYTFKGLQNLTAAAVKARRRRRRHARKNVAPSSAG